MVNLTANLVSKLRLLPWWEADKSGRLGHPASPPPSLLPLSTPPKPSRPQSAPNLSAKAPNQFPPPPSSPLCPHQLFLLFFAFIAKLASRPHYSFLAVDWLFKGWFNVWAAPYMQTISKNFTQNFFLLFLRWLLATSNVRRVGLCWMARKFI